MRSSRGARLGAGQTLAAAGRAQTSPSVSSGCGAASPLQGPTGRPATPSDPRSPRLVSQPGAGAVLSRERCSRVLVVPSSLCVTQAERFKFSKPQFLHLQNGLLQRRHCHEDSAALETPGPGCLSPGEGSVPSTDLSLVVGSLRTVSGTWPALIKASAGLREQTELSVCDYGP